MPASIVLFKIPYGWFRAVLFKVPVSEGHAIALALRVGLAFAPLMSKTARQLFYPRSIRDGRHYFEETPRWIEGTSGVWGLTVEGSAGGKIMSIVQDQIRQQFCPYRELSVVVDQAHCSEFVHEVRDARPRRAHHFGQGLVTQHGDSGIENEIMFT